MTERAVIFFEPNEALADGVRPLALEEVGGETVLRRMFRALSDSGVKTCFVAAPPAYDADIRACLPPDMSVTVSDRHDALMEFLDTSGAVAVLPRAALPMKQAGAGFAYAAPGRSLRDAWAVRLTNAVQDAQLLSGWLPLFGRDTLDELRPLFPPESDGTRFHAKPD
ncbi:MAG: hypothetical protein IJQ81_06845 [Oscillibacter sp.]|nr:hypothetical protein [Oscillibacter sp.]